MKYDVTVLILKSLGVILVTALSFTANIGNHRLVQILVS
jgi:hypothetical protein